MLTVTCDTWKSSFFRDKPHCNRKCLAYGPCNRYAMVNAVCTQKKETALIWVNCRWRNQSLIQHVLTKSLCMCGFVQIQCYIFFLKDCMQLHGNKLCLMIFFLGCIIMFDLVCHIQTFLTHYSAMDQTWRFHTYHWEKNGALRPPGGVHSYVSTQSH